MKRIFVSAARSNREAAVWLVETLSQMGAEARRSEDGFFPDEIEAADVVVLVLSQQTAHSQQVYAEIGWALQAKKLVVPLILEAPRLIAFPFLVKAEQLNLVVQTRTAIINDLLARLELKPAHPLSIPQYVLQHDTADDASIQVDASVVQTFFLAALEAGDREASTSLFLYLCVLLFGPHYAEGRLDGFIAAEVERLNGILLWDMSNRVSSSVRAGQLQTADWLVREMHTLAPDSPTTETAARLLLQAQIDRLNIEINRAIAGQQWEQAETFIQKMTDLHGQRGEAKRAEVHRSHLAALEKTVDSAIQKQQWKQAETTIQELIELDNQRGEIKRAEVRSSYLSTLEKTADAAIEEQHWEEAERLIEQIRTMDGNRSEAEQKKLRAAKLGWVETLANAAIDNDQWETADAMIDQLASFDPHEQTDLLTTRLSALGKLGLKLIVRERWEQAQQIQLRLQSLDIGNTYAASIQKQILEGQIEPFLSKARLAMQAGGWEEAIEASQQVLTLDPKNSQAIRMIAEAESALTCDALYEEAIKAAEANRYRSVAILFQRIRQKQPQFRDTENLLRGQPLQRDFARFVSQIARLEVNTEGISAFAFSDDGQYLVTGTQGDEVSLWELPSFERLSTWAGHKWVTDLALSADGQYLATLSSNGLLRMWQIDEQKPLFQQKGNYNKLAFSPDSKLLAAGTTKGEMLMWNVFTQAQVSGWKDDDSQVNDIAFSPDGTRLAVAHKLGLLNIYDVNWLPQKADSTETSRLDQFRIDKVERGDNPINAVAFLDNNKVLISVFGAGELIRIQDTDEPQGNRVQQIYKDNASFSVMAVSPDGSLLATAAKLSRLITFWDMATGEQLNVLQSGSLGVNALRFTADGLYLVSGDKSGSLVFWGVGSEPDPMVAKGKRDEEY